MVVVAAASLDPDRKAILFCGLAVAMGENREWELGKWGKAFGGDRRLFPVTPAPPRGNPCKGKCGVPFSNGVQVGDACGPFPLLTGAEGALDSVLIRSLGGERGGQSGVPAQDWAGLGTRNRSVRGHRCIHLSRTARCHR